MNQEATLMVNGVPIRVRYELLDPTKFPPHVATGKPADLAAGVDLLDDPGYLHEKLGPRTPAVMEALGRAFDEQVLKPMFDQAGRA